MARAPKPPFQFEHALEELNQCVSRLEQGDISLEQSLRDFEHGIALTRQCQQTLQQAEQKVQILMKQAQTEQLTDFKDTES